MLIGRVKPLTQGRLSMDDVDARMIKALADLPSDLGLEAVDKFANAHLDTVRSKTGFMVLSPCLGQVLPALIFP